jgi:hypothetical protein
MRKKQYFQLFLMNKKDQSDRKALVFDLWVTHYMLGAAGTGMRHPVSATGGIYWVRLYAPTGMMVVCVTFRVSGMSVGLAGTFLLNQGLLS